MLCKCWPLLFFFAFFPRPPQALLGNSYQELGSSFPLSLSLTQGLQEYEEWKWGKNPTVVEVLEEFRSIQMPTTLLLTQLSLLQPRYYSISSSPDMYPEEVHLTVAIVSYRTRGGHRCWGSLRVCASPHRGPWAETPLQTRKIERRNRAIVPLGSASSVQN